MHQRSHAAVDAGRSGHLASFKTPEGGETASTKRFEFDGKRQSCGAIAQTDYISISIPIWTTNPAGTAK